MNCRRLVCLVVAAAAAVTLAAAPGAAQPTTIRVDGKVIKGYIAAMSGPEQQGRKSLTPGYEKVADWAAAEFKEWGLAPAGDNGTYFQAVPITGARAEFAWSLGVPTLAVNGRPFLVRDNDFAIDAGSTPGAKADAEVVFVGYGISAPAKGLDEYAGVNVSGRIVLVLKGSPSQAPALRASFAPDAAGQPDTTDWTAETSDAAKIKTAHDKGAAAIMLYDPDPPAQPAGAFGGVGGGGRGARPVAPAFTRPFLVVSNIEARVFRAVMWQEAQQSLREFNARLDDARRAIRAKRPQSKATGVRAQIKGYDGVARYGERYKNNVSRNVLAKIVGTDPKLKDQYVVIGGHLDHLGVTNGVVMNGADDNASGSAVTMEVARLLAANKVKPKRTIIFGLWCGEEMGLLGSNYYTKTPSDGLSMDRVVTYFNMDMVGLGNRIGAPGANNFPEIFEVIKRDQLPEVISIVDARTAGPGGSDYSGFMLQGIEALALMTSGGVGHVDYHDSGDDTEKIEPEILAKTGQFVLQGALNVANETKVNLLIPDRLNLYTGSRLAIPDLVSIPDATAAAPGAGGGRRGGGGATRWTALAAPSQADLLALVNERVAALKTPAAQQAGGFPARAGGGAPGGPSVTVGVRGAGVFGGSLEFLLASSAVLDFGRLDVASDDGVWFSNGVTPKGRAAIKAIQAANIALNLVNPSATLLREVLAAADKPVIVSGVTSVEPALAAVMNAKNALLVVEIDLADTSAAIAKIEAAKNAFGDADNIQVSAKPAEAPSATREESARLDLQQSEAKKRLYVGLLEAGWSKDAVTAITGGNLARFSVAPRTRPTTD